MAVEQVITSKSLVLTMFEGMDEDGKSISKKYTIPNLKSTSTPDQIQNAADALATLYVGAAEFIGVTTTEELIKTTN